jgi:hypothetical protein
MNGHAVGYVTRRKEIVKDFEGKSDDSHRGFYRCGPERVPV